MEICKEDSFFFFNFIELEIKDKSMHLIEILF